MVIRAFAVPRVKAVVAEHREAFGREKIFCYVIDVFVVAPRERDGVDAVGRLEAGDLAGGVGGEKLRGDAAGDEEKSGLTSAAIPVRHL